MGNIISIETYDRVISHLNFGESVAEDDNLLQNARIETSACSELMTDKVDLITGCKGSGKTALFKLREFNS